ncbi:MAG: SAF domain-containing protein, partial [Gammaproteobacteria bacterium]|nr:SAF domain-containing protein [Gammaproteobacteria bacterium]
DDGGPDDSFSLEPDALKQLCRDVKTAWASAGRIRREPKAAERHTIRFRRSLYVVQDMRAGDAFTADNVRSIRPGFGMAPKHLDEVLGKTAARDITRGTPLSPNLIRS